VSQYQSIDPALASWAQANSIHWFSEYQDVEVRVFNLNANSGGHVQVSVDVPIDQQTVVRVGQNRRGLSRLHRRAEFPTSVLTLTETLDRVLRVANDWLAEDQIG
jgi:hypothetical protein